MACSAASWAPSTALWACKGAAATRPCAMSEDSIGRMCAVPCRRAPRRAWRSRRAAAMRRATPASRAHWSAASSYRCTGMLVLIRIIQKWAFLLDIKLLERRIFL